MYPPHIAARARARGLNACTHFCRRDARARVARERLGSFTVIDRAEMAVLSCTLLSLRMLVSLARVVSEAELTDHSGRVPVHVVGP
jgi:hypothetical protein